MRKNIDVKWIIVPTIVLLSAVGVLGILLDEKSTKFIILILTIVVSVFAILNMYIMQIKKLNEEKLEKALFEDNLTKIRNYDKFIIDGEEYLSKADKSKCVVICFDIHKFKLINDIYGYKIGDEILKCISSKLDLFFNKTSVYGRLTSDVFGILIELDDLDKHIDSIVKALKNKVANLKDVNDFSNSEINVDLSIGICKLNEKGYFLKKATDNADVARLKAKEASHEEYILFDDNMRKEKKTIMQIEQDMFLAIKNNQFQVYYQPKFDISKGRILSSEALIRWIHPTMGIISPIKFIPIAEKNRYINEIGKWVFNEVCLNLRAMIDEGINVVPVAINISRVELYQNNLITSLSSALRKHNIDPQLIEIEITESTALNDIDFICQKLNEIKKLGIKVAMDDFGTGNSNLSNLKYVPIDILKLDRSLLLDIETNFKTKVMVKSVLNLCNDLDLGIVCEGVENIEQVNILSEIGCSIIQGYVFSKPIKTNEYKMLLRIENP